MHCSWMKNLLLSLALFDDKVSDATCVRSFLLFLSISSFHFSFSCLWTFLFYNAVERQMRMSKQTSERASGGVRERKQAKLFYINQKLCLPQNMEQWIPTGKPAHIQMNGQQRKRIENKSLGLNWVNGTKDVNEMDGMPHHDRIDYTNYDIAQKRIQMCA